MGAGPVVEAPNIGFELLALSAIACVWGFVGVEEVSWPRPLGLASDTGDSCWPLVFPVILASSEGFIILFLDAPRFNVAVDEAADAEFIPWPSNVTGKIEVLVGAVDACEDAGVENDGG